MALVHDWLNQRGGAENVLEELVDLFAGPPVYTSIYAAGAMPPAYRRWSIRTSFLQGWPGVASHHQAYLPLYPLAFRAMDLSGYDLVLSNKSGFCHGVGTRSASTRALHVCYCLTPTRFLWQYQQYRERERIGRVGNGLLQPLLALLRRWDRAAAQRVDHFIAISSVVQRRIEQIYGRQSVIIHPPVDTERFTPDAATPVGDYYLVVSRLVPYKRLDLAVAAFAHLPREKLIVVGEGRDRAALEAQAGPNVTFLGRQPAHRLVELLRGCKAFLFPGEEDFGIAPLEAMSAGRPVIAYAGGGALDTVVAGITGDCFARQSVESLVDVLERFAPRAYSPAACRAQAEKFSRPTFRRRLLSYLEQLSDATRTPIPARAHSDV